MTQTADQLFEGLDSKWFPRLRVVVDGRNSLRNVDFSPAVTVHGIGIPARKGSAAR
jgi:hypothetical protein